MPSRPAGLRRRGARSVLAWTLVFAAPVPASAHMATRASVVASLHERNLTLDIEVLRRDMGDALGLVRGGGEVTAGMIDANRRRVYARLARDIRVSARGHWCQPTDRGSRSSTRGSEYSVVQTIEYACARRGDLRIRYDFYFDRDRLHEAIVRTEGSTSGHEAFVLSNTRRTHALMLEAGVLDNVVEFGRSGVRHIFTGYDHICFLLALVLMAGLALAERGFARGTRYAAGVVTGFTVGHSVTLALAALGVLRPNMRIIEAAIAASIVFVAVENVVAKHTRPRFLLTAAFGLIHGFGFAGVLAEEGLPRNGLVLSLVSFNLGIELGQLVIVTLLIGPLALVARRPFFRRAIFVPGSVAIAVIGATWLAERIFGFKILPV